jgi:hypothetical protein
MRVQGLGSGTTASETIALVEAEGWRLEFFSSVFRQTASTSRDKFVKTGQNATVLGEVLGIYVFRAVEPAPLEA